MSAAFYRSLEATHEPARQRPKHSGACCSSSFRSRANSALGPTEKLTNAFCKYCDGFLCSEKEYAGNWCNPHDTVKTLLYGFRQPGELLCVTADKGKAPYPFRRGNDALHSTFGPPNQGFPVSQIGS